jgi:hypothetical protein
MELAKTAMSERQRAYRANYRQRVAGWYNGFLHIAIIYVIGFTALYVYLSNVESPSLLELLTVPVTFLFCNFFEWWLHRYVMHRPSSNPIARAVYNGTRCSITSSSPSMRCASRTIATTA